MGSVGVGVDTTVESDGGVLTEGGTDQGLSTRMFGQEGGAVVNNTGDNDQALLVGGLFVELVLGPDWQLRDLRPPVQLASHFVQLLLLLLQDTLVDGVLRKFFQVVSQTDLGCTPDEDLGWVVLVPLEGVSVIGWELVVEVVVALTKGDKGSEEVVS